MAIPTSLPVRRFCYAGFLAVILSETLSQIDFRDALPAATNLVQVKERVPTGVYQALLTVLRDSPDPDSALNLFERLTQDGDQQLMRLLEQRPTLVHYAVAVFAHSQFLGETLIQNPDLFQLLAKDKNLERSHSREDFRESLARYRSRSFETNISVLLARFKRREYIRIVLRDVLGVADLADTTAEISALADVLLEEALREVDASMRSRYGIPQAPDASGRLVDLPVAILSLGKLGGNEVNYSSDVDLLFLFGDGERDSAAPPETNAISNREYFIRLAQGITEVLSRITREGSVFRIDLRLRPQGNDGEPAIALTPALHYYKQSAHDWELQALIKVRHSAGDVGLGRAFIRGVQSHVYSQQLNFAAIETAIHSLEKISLRRRRQISASPAAPAIDVKLDRGGIRDIEFLVQCLQRVYGGKEKWLRSGGTLFSLQKLHDKAHISSKDYQELTSAYAFLRKVEHRLQLRRGQQLHRLPDSEDDLRVLCATMVERGAEQLSTADSLEDLCQRMARVAEVYGRIIHSEQQHRDQAANIDEFVLSPTLPSPGREPSYPQMLERIAADSPELYRVVTQSGLSDFARRNLHRFLSSAMTTSERYAMLRSHPRELEHALQIFETSGYFSDVLAQHPEIVAEFAGFGGAASENSRRTLLFAPPSRDLQLELAGGESANGRAQQDAVFQYVISADIGDRDKMDLLRQRFRQKFFESATRDVIQPRPVYDSLAHTTRLTDRAVAAALEIAGAPEGFVVLALGRLGTQEFDWASDADLLFVRAEDCDPKAAITATQKIVEVLSAYTRFGNLFAVDARLRPHGGEGELVNTPATLRNYFAEEAQGWEALTFTKLRYIAGSRATAAGAMGAVNAGIERFAGDGSFMSSVREMRTRLQRADAGRRQSSFKTSVGGFYDIDFVLSVVQVNHHLVPSAINTRQQINDLAARSLLAEEDAHTLDQAAELLRSCDHALRLVTGRSRKSLPENEAARAAATELTRKILGRNFPGELHDELQRSAARVREVYERLLGT